MAMYLVMRKEAIHYGRGDDYSMIKSSHFPILVHLYDEDPTPERIVQAAFRQRGWDNYNPKNKTYVVVKVEDLCEVSFVPKPDYDVVVRYKNSW